MSLPPWPNRNSLPEPQWESEVVLITGGTGSFGHSMAVHLLDDLGCGEIRILSRDEAKQEEMRTRLGDSRLKFHLGDVRDQSSLDRLMPGVTRVFHAAALKQVPSSEFFPIEAVKTNVLGSENVIRSACFHNVRSVVCLSTDKAVYPINAMGMSKGLMEKLVRSTARAYEASKTIVSCVRYGNVMYSRGSVIPRMVQQIRSGENLTITDPLMTRFILPLAEAVELVDIALVHSEPGDIFIRKSPAIDIGTLAATLQELFQAKNPVQIIGVRHGEKLHETLATKEEMRTADDLGNHLRLRMDRRDLNYDEFLTTGDIAQQEVEDFTSLNAPRLSGTQICEILQKVPEIRNELGRLGLGTDG